MPTLPGVALRFFMKSNPPSTRPRVLVAEDEPSIRDAITYPLESDGCDVRAFGTGAETLEAVAAAKFDVVILDVGLPDMTGFEVCRKIRERHSLPILFLTARADEIDRVVGLEIGGDDYVTKPFSPRELSARVRALLRRVARENGGAPSGGGAVFAIDEERFAAHYHGRRLDLTRYEFRLLTALLRQPGRVFSRAQLMDAAWEEPEASMERTVDAHIKSLRAKLRAAGAADDPIHTHRGLGYSLELPPA